MAVTRLLPLLALTAVLVAGCSGEGDPRVEVREVGRATVQETVDAPGTVAARAVSSLVAPSDAVVTEVLVQDGALVEQGAVLARLTSGAAQERLRQAVAAREQVDVGGVQVARGDLGPVQDALDAAAEQSFAVAESAAAQIPDPVARAAAELQVLDARRQYATASNAARATLRTLDRSAASIERALGALATTQRAQADAAVGAAQAVLDALTITAPITGVVTLGAGGGEPATGAGDLSGLLDGLPQALQGRAGAVLGAGGAGSSASTVAGGLAPGALVSAGDPLLTVTDVGGLTVLAEVDETDVLLVQPGTEAVVEVDAVPGARYPATVRAVDLAPTTSTGGGVSYQIRLQLLPGTTADEEPAPTPRPGMSAVVDLQVRTAVDAVAVPSAAVVRDEGRDAVFVVEGGDDGATVQRRAVRLGAQGLDLVEVLSGVEPGERVVVRDADRLRDGQAVTS